MKTCISCKDAKPLSSFWKAKGRPDGLSPYCTLCDRKRKKESRERNSEATKAANRKGAVRYKERHRARVLDNDKAQAIKKRGLTTQAYRQLLDTQNGGCAICGRTQNEPRFAIDHDHRTGRVRGLLCSACNTALGKFRDSPMLLRKAASYLEQHTCRLVGLSGRKGAGKDASANALVSAGFHRVAFAAPLKSAVRDIFGWSQEHTDGALKEVTDPAWGLSPRTVMQRFGTEVGRSVHSELWVKSLERKLRETWKTSPTARFVVTDVRFPNEAELIKKLGGQVWRVERPSLGPAVDLHPSETSLDDYAFDHVIMNDGSLDDLYARVAGLLV